MGPILCGVGAHTGGGPLFEGGSQVLLSHIWSRGSILGRGPINLGGGGVLLASPTGTGGPILGGVPLILRGGGILLPSLIGGGGPILGGGPINFEGGAHLVGSPYWEGGGSLLWGRVPSIAIPYMECRGGSYFLGGVPHRMFPIGRRGVPFWGGIPLIFGGGPHLVGIPYWGGVPYLGEGPKYCYPIYGVGGGVLFWGGGVPNRMSTIRSGEGSIWGYRGVYGCNYTGWPRGGVARCLWRVMGWLWGDLWVQLHGVTTGWRCELSMGGYGGVIQGVCGCNYTV